MLLYENYTAACPWTIYLNKNYSLSKCGKKSEIQTSNPIEQFGMKLMNGYRRLYSEGTVICANSITSKESLE